MNKNVLKAAFAGFVFFISNIANAGLIYFTDRAEFESKLSTFEVDGFDSLTSRGQGTYSSSLISYSGSMYGCTTDGGGANTGCNFSSSFDVPGNEWLWTYNSSGSFTTSYDVSAFGFDYASTISPYIVNSLNLNGVTSSDLSSGFFGVISDDNSLIGNQFIMSWNASSNYLGYDNVILSTDVFTGQKPSGIPEPSTLAIFALGILGLASRKVVKR